MEYLVKAMMKGLCIFMFIYLSMLAQTKRVQAVPSLPASFYGTLKINRENAPDGTLIEALVNDRVTAQAFSRTYQGDSVYSLDVPGDDTATSPVEGGKEGDVISFRVGGVIANEQAVWHTAANTALDLTVTTTLLLETPRSTPTPLATQTAIIVNDSASPSYTDTPIKNTDLSPLITDTLALEDEIIVETPAIISSSSTPTARPTSTESLAAAAGSMGVGPGISPAIIVFLMIIAIGLFSGFIYARSKNMRKQNSKPRNGPHA
jgi:hypothetical protein